MSDLGLELEHALDAGEVEAGVQELGDNLDLERIEAAYRDGVLRLRVPVAEKATPRKIEVQMGSKDENKAISA